MDALGEPAANFLEVNISHVNKIASWLIFAGLAYLGISSLPGMAAPVHFTQTAQTVPALDQVGATVPFETATLACG